MNLLTDKEKADWVTALRSGDYKQGKYYLYKPNGCHCSLGVLGSVLGIDNADMSLAGNLSQINALSERFTSRYVALRDDNSGERYSLTIMNDYYDWSFDEIADKIEESTAIFSSDVNLAYYNPAEY